MNLKKIIHSTTLVFIATALLDTTAWAAKVYKWVDQDGQIHYSQTPPKPKDSVAKENVQSVTTTRAIVVSKQGKYEYCGKLRLPGPFYDSKQILRTIDRQVESWRETIRRLEGQYSLNSQLRDIDRARQDERYKRYAKKSGYSYNNSQSDYQARQRQENNRKIAEYRCAIAWSDSKKSELSDLKRELAYDAKRAKLSYQEALEIAQRECGFEPNDFSHPLYREKEENWQHCMKSHRAAIRRLKYSMEKAISAASESRVQID